MSLSNTTVLFIAWIWHATHYDLYDLIKGYRSNTPQQQKPSIENPRDIYLRMMVTLISLIEKVIGYWIQNLSGFYTHMIPKPPEFIILELCLCSWWNVIIYLHIPFKRIICTHAMNYSIRSKFVFSSPLIGVPKII